MSCTSATRKITPILFLRLLTLAAVALLPLVAAPGRAQAALILTLTQVGGSVVVNGSGTLNTAALTYLGLDSEPAQIVPSLGILFAGSSSSTILSDYGGGGLTGPAAFGTGSNNVFASSGTGSTVGIDGYQHTIRVPQGYVSGTLLTDSSTFTGQTFATLGFTPGTYTYTWGSGLNADSLVITSVVPEPSTWVLFIAGGVLLFAVAFRRRRA